MTQKYCIYNIYVAGRSGGVRCGRAGHTIRGGAGQTHNYRGGGAKIKFEEGEGQRYNLRVGGGQYNLSNDKVTGSSNIKQTSAGSPLRYGASQLCRVEALSIT